ncbi:hypothetical protein SAMN05421721_107127 [Ectothiorhodospira mobilis]|uniref:Uncharacterized protein n=1 Tax=Ectothiorhodospira mobilis TaxID=195064 RepID=A0A1I4RDL3_ECTMO|nr:hypothetical protein [Ectothiorhodospira mobilis]SFM50361.1 hypothetical protein SAMN05421721_107127 [Ectothiorhodospira mobilis]
MSQPHVPVEDLQCAFQAIPEEMGHGIQPPEPSEMYVVPGHESALNPDTAVVVGDRGTGKSFWSAALNGETTRMVIGRQLKRLRLDKVQVGWGFSSGVDNRNHPSRRVLGRLLDNGFRAEDIWRTVILHQLMAASEDSPFRDVASWDGRVQRLAEDPEMEERLFASLDDQLRARGERHVVVFDALERIGEDWRRIRILLRGLLRVGLDLRQYRAIRTKFFIRPDMWEDEGIWAFPDSSKLTHGAVDLKWRRADLYALLWHQLGNDPDAGAAFRDWVAASQGESFEPVEIDGTVVYVVPEALRTRDTAQAAALNAIASPFMGRNRRRGKTHTWLPTHLADAKGQISPRSFLVALKKAQTITERRYPGEGVLLHFEGIKQGVQEASSIRLAELREDYPWVRQILAPLKGMTVPASAEEFYARWREAHVLEAIRERAGDGQEDEDGPSPYLPPHALETPTAGRCEEDALIEAAIEIGVMSRTADGRLNIPDLFRVAAGIGRRGGVRAIR